MKQRLIPDLTAVVCVCLLTGSQIAPAGADWTTRPSATGYYSDSGSYKTPPPGGWEDILEQEIQQEQARREKASSEQSAESSSKTEDVKSTASTESCNDTQAQQQQVFNAYNNAAPGFRSQAYNGRHGRDSGRNRHRNRGARGGFGMPWDSDRGGNGFSMPWGGDRGGRGFRSPWGDDGFGFHGPW
jgi:hypothetical protein